MYSLNCLYNLQKMLRNYSLFLRLVVLIHTPLCISERFQNNISDRTLAMAVGTGHPSPANLQGPQSNSDTPWAS